MLSHLPLDNVLSALNCGVFILDEDRKVIYCNSWLERKSGIKAEDCLGRDMFDLFPGILSERWEDALDDALKKALPSVLTQALNMQGLPLFSTAADREMGLSSLDQSITITPLSISEGERGCLIQITDVSGMVKRERALEHQVRTREQSETILKDSEARFRDFANAASDWLWEADSDHRFTYFSKRSERELGITQSRAIGKTRDEMLRMTLEMAQALGKGSECAYDKKAWDDHLKTIAEHQPFRNLEYPLFDGAGTIRYVRVSGVPIFEGGVFQGYRGTATDITEVRKTVRALEETRTYLQTLVDNTPAKIHIKNMNGEFLLANSVIADLIDAAPSDMIGRKTTDFMASDSAMEYEQHDIDVLKSGTPSTQEEIFIRDGIEKTFLTVKFPLRDSSGEINAIAAVGVDISVQKKAEREARSQSLLFHSLLDNAPFLVHIRGIDGRYTHINKYSRTLFELGDRDIKGLSSEQLFPPEIAKKFNDHDALINKEHDQEIRLHRYSLNGVEKVFLITKFYQYDLDGRPYAIVSIGADVSYEIMARREAEKSRALLMDAINSLSQGFVLYDSDERLVLWNKTFEELYSTIADILRPGVTFETVAREMINRGVVIDIDDPEAWVIERLRRFRAKELGTELHHATGQWHHHDDFLTSDGGTVGIRTDITLLKNRENELMLSQKRLQAAQAIARLGSWEWYIEDDRMSWSDEMYRICGYEPGAIEPSYAAYLDLLDPQGQEDIAAIASGLKNVQIEGNRQEVRLRLKDGTEKWAAVEYVPIEDLGGIIGLRGTVQDISRSKSMESQLLQATKMSALGETAAGLAHEMSQPLAVTRFAVEGLMRRLKSGQVDNSQILSRLETIDGQMERMGKLIDQIRIFIRNEEQSKEAFDPVRAINLSVTMLQPRLTKQQIKFSVIEGVESAKLYGSKIQFEQVIINLVNNAAYAVLSSAENGALSGEGEISVSLDAEDDRTIVVQVRDNGGGIKDDDLEHVFDPFFTTKSAGSGTGLGLSICSQIVKSMGGEISVRNEGQGACFSIKIPVYDGDDAEENDKLFVSDQSAAQQLRPSSILVVDDEKDLRDEIAAFFSDNGMDVFIASSAEQGQELFASHTIDLVVTDLYMPGIGGRQLVTELRALNPGLPIIVLTGHIGTVQHGIDQEVAGASCVLAKPVRPDDIWLRVYELLSGEGKSSAAVR